MAIELSNKNQRVLIDIIRDEGGTVMETQRGGKHLKVSYTFDGDARTHYISMPYGGGKVLSPNWLRDFRSSIRRSKRKDT